LDKNFRRTPVPYTSVHHRWRTGRNRAGAPNGVIGSSRVATLPEDYDPTERRRVRRLEKALWMAEMFEGDCDMQSELTVTRPEPLWHLYDMNCYVVHCVEQYLNGGHLVRGWATDPNGCRSSHVWLIRDEEIVDLFHWSEHTADMMMTVEPLDRHAIREVLSYLRYEHGVKPTTWPGSSLKS
jgi:hypothetical protein